MRTDREEHKVDETSCTVMGDYFLLFIYMLCICMHGYSSIVDDSSWISTETIVTNKQLAHMLFRDLLGRCLIFGNWSEDQGLKGISYAS